MSTLKVDAHLHLWRYEQLQYDWIEESMSSLRRDFLPEQLLDALESAGIDGGIAVQARQSLEETDFLLSLAERHPCLLGVVGWAPLSDPDLTSVLDRFRGSSKLKGLRHVIQGESDDRYLLRPDFNRGIDSLKGFGLTYDILILERHLPVTIEFVDRHPQQLFVLDHVAKPRIAAQEREPWAGYMLELARRQNVFCKVSGMVTEDDWIQQPPGFADHGRLAPYLDVVVEAFGPDRMIAGSDWPVCLLGISYSRWFAFLHAYFAGFSSDEQEAIFGGNAVKAYSL